MRSKQMMGWWVALGALLAVQVASAQGPPPREGRPSPEQMEQRERERMEEMRERLQLSEEQEQQVQPIFEDAAKQMRSKHEELRSQGQSRSSMQTMQKEMQKIEKATRQRLEPILSAEQLVEYDELQSEWKQQRNRQRRGHQG